ncbi:hypothetical protein GcM1_193005 [Golovinomyces cichoracearum]|uniref:Uncharacterized protein n=1 Tax=Golovinomyces cichoracearum TaxID=62708 RepID=A0A420J0R3_9PEZI|nr:hypothetical protein GcM1_193005 [Golovinomyces cichoracearum]
MRPFPESANLKILPRVVSVLRSVFERDKITNRQTGFHSRIGVKVPLIRRYKHSSLEMYPNTHDLSPRQENSKDVSNSKKTSDQKENEDKKSNDQKASEQKKSNDEKDTEDKKSSDQKETEDEKSSDQKGSDQKKSNDQKESAKKSSDQKDTGDKKSSDQKDTDDEKSNKKSSDQKGSDQKKSSDQKESAKKTSDQKEPEAKKSGDQSGSDKEKISDQISTPSDAITASEGKKKAQTSEDTQKGSGTSSKPITEDQTSTSIASKPASESQNNSGDKNIVATKEIPTGKDTNPEKNETVKEKELNPPDSIVTPPSKESSSQSSKDSKAPPVDQPVPQDAKKDANIQPGDIPDSKINGKSDDLVALSSNSGANLSQSLPNITAKQANHDNSSSNVLKTAATICKLYSLILKQILVMNK